MSKSEFTFANHMDAAARHISHADQSVRMGDVQSGRFYARQAHVAAVSAWGLSNAASERSAAAVIRDRALGILS